MQRQYPGAGGEPIKAQIRERRFQLVKDEVDFGVVPAVTGLRPARRQLAAFGKRHVADVQPPALAQEREKVTDKNDLLFIRQMVQRVSRDDGVILPRLQLRGETLVKSPQTSVASGIFSCARAIIRSEKSCPKMRQSCA